MNEEIEKIKEILDNVKKCCDIDKDTNFVVYQKQGIVKLLNYITNLQDENEKLNKIIVELEKWLKETKKFNYGFKIKSEYIYTYEFVCKNILNKLTKLKKEVE